jgi:hypothetical protein
VRYPLCCIGKERCHSVLHSKQDPTRYGADISTHKVNAPTLKAGTLRPYMIDHILTLNSIVNGQPSQLVHQTSLKMPDK